MARQHGDGQRRKLERFARHARLAHEAFADEGTVGTPAPSQTALARSTAGVQLPQAPTPEMTQSTSSSRSFSGSAARIARSSAPWVLPNAAHGTNFMAG